VIVGGRDAWMLADRLKTAGVAVVLTLDWGDEPKDPDADAKPENEDPKPAPDADAEADAEDPDAAEAEGTEGEADESQAEAQESDEAQEWIYEEPHSLKVERRRLWVQHRDGARQLVASGVQVAFGSAADSAKDLRKRIADLVEAGLDPAAATRALTVGAAELFGAADRIGAVQPGFEAHLALWTDAPWADRAKLSWLIVDGESFELSAAKDADDEADAEVEATGDWRLHFVENDRADAAMKLSMSEDGSVTGVAKYSARNGDEFEVNLQGSVSGDRLSLTATTQVEGFPIEISIDAKIEGDTMTGKTVWKTAGGSETNEFRGERSPEGEGQ
jgi:hypothetical protein